MKVAVAQINSRDDVNENLEVARSLVKEARAAGASWVVFPENAPYMGPSATKKLAVAESVDGPIIGAYRELARRNGVSITVGSFVERSEEPNRTYNTLVMIDANGDVVETYRKIHLFNVETTGGLSYNESATVKGGSDVKVCTVSDGETTFKVGLSICYDLRFPELYRRLRSLGAEVLLVPAAFTLETGREHWLTLLRARAIENQSYVVAAGQVGVHFKERETYGHSVVYDPWGREVALIESGGVGIAVAELDRGVLEEVRRKMPVESHRVLK